MDSTPPPSTSSKSLISIHPPSISQSHHSSSQNPIPGSVRHACDATPEADAHNYFYAKAESLKSSSLSEFTKKMYAKNKHNRNRVYSNNIAKGAQKHQETEDTEKHRNLDDNKKTEQTDLNNDARNDIHSPQCRGNAIITGSYAERVRYGYNQSRYKRVRMNKSLAFKAEQQRKTHIVHLLKNDPRRFKIIPFIQLVAAKRIQRYYRNYREFKLEREKIHLEQVLKRIHKNLARATIRKYVTLYFLKKKYK